MEYYDKKIEELTRELEAAKKAQADAAHKEADEQYKKLEQTIDTVTDKYLKCLSDVIQVGNKYKFTEEELKKILPSHNRIANRLFAEAAAAIMLADMSISGFKL